VSRTRNSSLVWATGQKPLKEAIVSGTQRLRGNMVPGDAGVVYRAGSWGGSVIFLVLQALISKLLRVTYLSCVLE
jgi:hypothetical protein